MYVTRNRELRNTLWVSLPSMVIFSGTPCGRVRAVRDDPTVHGGVSDGDAAFEHELFDMARALWGGDVPADTRQDDILGEMGSLCTRALAMVLRHCH